MQIIQESNIEKLINRVVGEIYNAATLDEEAIYLNQPYFKTSREDNPNIPFDPFRQQIKKFDYKFVLDDMRRFVTYHINKTLGIVNDHPYGKNDPMVTPIAERLTSAFYDDALGMGYIEENPNIDKQSWYSGSVIKYHIEDRLDESIDWSDKKGNKYHRNGMVNRVVGDFLKMVELTHQSVIFHMTQHMESPQRTHNDPYLTYIYDENGLTQESKDLLYEGLTNGIQWYMEHTGLIDYRPPHSSNDTRPPEDVELIKMIADTLHPLIVKAVTDYNEDEGWTRDTLYSGKFLRESKGDFKDSSKQEQYVNYVLKHLMDNTEWADASWSQLLLNDHISLSSYINYGEFELFFIPDGVKDILKGFGVTNQEEDEIWDFYSKWVLEKVMREGNVNWPNRETHKKRYPHILQFRLTESKDNTTKFAEKIAKEIIGASTLSGKLLYFYPPVVEEAKDEGPISADVNSDWIHNDSSTGVYHLTTDIRRIGRLYIKKIMGPGIDREDPIFKQVNDIVIDNILQRARNHDWMKEVGGMRDLRDKHGFLRESIQPKYLDKIFNSIIKEIKFDAGQHGAVIIPFISRERYSSTTGVLDRIEYQIPKHDRNIELRDEGVLHSAFNSYLKEIYGLGEEESYEVFDRVRQYIKDELYYRSVLHQILISVQDDYIEGYGAKIDITPERTIDLKNYDDFKEYLDWWHGIIEPDYDDDGTADITDNMVKKLYDEVWDTLKNTITLNEGWPAEPEVGIGEDGEEYEKYDRMFPDKFYLKIFKMIDKDPEFFMTEILRNLGFEPEEEYDILHNYFVNYSDRKDYYVDFTIDPQDIAHFFEDRDYDMAKMVKEYLEGDSDSHDWYNESFEFSDYFLDYINDGSWNEIAKILEVDNIADAEELMSGDIGNEHLEDKYELMENTIEDVQGVIARSMTEAQADADMAYLHQDILDEVNDFFKHGKYSFDQGEFVGSVELGDVMTELNGLPSLEAELVDGYPDFAEVVNNILHEELNDWGYNDEYVFTGFDKPNINTDKHFRYGGAGTIDDNYFNDLLVDRLSWDYTP